MQLGCQHDQQKLALMHQMMRLAERASFCINLDYFRWLISYGWNLGIQKYKQGGVQNKDHARIYIQFCYSLLEQLQMIKQKQIGQGAINSSQWESLGFFLDMVAPKMAEANAKLMYV